MTDRRPLLAAILVGVLALAALAVLTTGSGPGDSGAGARPGGGPAAGTSSTTASPGPTDPARATAGASPGAGPTGATRSPGAAGEASGRTATGRALEMPADARTTARLPGLARERRRERAARAELTADFPALRTRRAALVPDHPRRTVPVPGSAEVTSSSVASESGTTQVGVVAQVHRTVDRALRFYRIRLGRIGFREVDVPPAADGTAVSWRRRRDRVVVVARPADDGTELVVHAMLRTGG